MKGRVQFNELKYKKDCRFSGCKGPKGILNSCILCLLESREDALVL